MIQLQDLPPDALAALLHFYADAGVDVLMEDEPVDRFAEFAAERQARGMAMQAQRAAAAPQATGQPQRGERGAAPQRPAPAGAQPIPLPDQEAVAEARRVAAAAMTLEDLRGAIDAFDHCGLKRGARSTILAGGECHTGIMVVGAIPGSDEDAGGTAFAGRSGALFDRMLSSIGLTREKVAAVTALPWRPPGNRQPTQAEMDICRPFVERQIALCNPRIVLVLGNFAARYLIDPNASIQLIRGEWKRLQVEDRAIPALPSLHPDDLLRAPASKRLAWQDLLAFRQKLDELGLG
ncbi:uracil-DNA glycosylase [Gellertiella hungarica]|uniref:Type-4 uracil-DNA glycosylase n=1 Tax=Gellertiella hungarica TaxID=1572859 RepID=A0A7W6J6H3_9HYPH|nr:uracil-DNA glycosylase [Gellertiella hungarica]MBB4065685.1 DNA polymerase [Gellertiella hungarica]